MSRTQRTITVGLWSLVVLSLLGLLAMTRLEHRQQQEQDAARSQLLAGQLLEVDPATGKLVPATQKVEDYTFPAPSFALTDQQDKPFDSSQLKGKVWTAMFFFSECQGVCPSMTERIRSLQKVTDDPRIQCVSFSVDPLRDTPAKLAKYAEKTQADPARWHLLTGDPADMRRVALGFRLPYDQPTDHSSKIMLVDTRGVVRGYYESRNTDEMFKLMDDAKKLVAESSPATQPTAPAASSKRKAKPQ